ncbi:MAG: CpaD family pilus assembly lipoprotein [Magnetovibrionaceae bacterium]
MKPLSKTIIILLAGLGLGACTAGGAGLEDWSNVHALPTPEAKSTVYAQDVRFDANSHLLGEAEVTNLRNFLERTEVRPGDRLIIQTAGKGGITPDPVAERRIAKLEGTLAIWGYGAEIVRADLPGDRLRVAIERVSVVFPGCPDWTREPGRHFNNQPHGNFGCATAMNLGLMVADPRDLMGGRDPGPGVGEFQVLGQQRYRKGETTAIEPEDINVSQGGQAQTDSE